jgi:hypothetical protein
LGRAMVSLLPPVSTEESVEMLIPGRRARRPTVEVVSGRARSFPVHALGRKGVIETDDFGVVDPHAVEVALLEAHPAPKRGEHRCFVFRWRAEGQAHDVLLPLDGRPHDFVHRGTPRPDTRLRGWGRAVLSEEALGLPLRLAVRDQDGSDSGPVALVPLGLLLPASAGRDRLPDTYPHGLRPLD